MFKICHKLHKKRKKLKSKLQQHLKVMNQSYKNIGKIKFLKKNLFLLKKF